MKVAVSSSGNETTSAVSPVFGRCAYFVIVDTDTMQATPMLNQAAAASGGAGVQASQNIVRSGVEAVITGNLGPNADQVLSAAGIKAYGASDMTVEQAVEALKAGKLAELSGPSVAKDFGKAPGGMGGSRGIGGGRGMGGGRGRRG